MYVTMDVGDFYYHFLSCLADKEGKTLAELLAKMIDGVVQKRMQHNRDCVKMAERMSFNESRAI